jgi:hypothetical protein
MAKVSYKTNPKEMMSPPAGAKFSDAWTDQSATAAGDADSTANMNAVNQMREPVTTYKDGGNKKGAARSGK